MKKVRVGLLGATGLVGQTYLRALIDHPFFEVTHVAASERSAGKRLHDVLSSRGHPLEGYEDAVLESVFDVDRAFDRCDLIFSALPSSTATKFDPLYAKELAVISHASSFRNDPDIPLLIPEINPEHLEIIESQQKNRGFNQGYLVSKPNCSIMSSIIPLFPLHKKYGLKKVTLTNLQSVSGAGHCGLSAVDILGNVVPFIPGEEQKSENEPLKIMGSIQSDKIVPVNNIAISSQCMRVPVLYGHLSCVSAEFEDKPALEEVLELWKNFRGKTQKLACPSAPRQLIEYSKDPYRPQPRIDAEKGMGMSIQVGRLQNCQTHDIRFVALSHNVNRGAALGGLLSAELLYKEGKIPRVKTLEKATL